MGEIEGPVNTLIRDLKYFWPIDNFIDEYFESIKNIDNKTV